MGFFFISFELIDWSLGQRWRLLHSPLPFPFLFSVLINVLSFLKARRPPLSSSNRCVPSPQRHPFVVPFACVFSICLLVVHK